MSRIASSISTHGPNSLPPVAHAAGYCHLKYIVSNGSGNDIADVAVVPPGRDKLQFVHVIHAGSKAFEVDSALRKMDPQFADYPVELLFTDRWGLTWYVHWRMDRVKSLVPNPRTIRDYRPHRNPQGMATLRRQGYAMLAGVVVVVAVACGVVATTDGDLGGVKSPKSSSTASVKDVRP